MRLRYRLALVVVLFMTTFLAGFSLMLLREVPDRADAETEAAVQWVWSLLPERVDASARGPDAALEDLVRLVRGLEKIRHVTVALHRPDGERLALAPLRPQAVPDWLQGRVKGTAPLRKTVTAGGVEVGYFEVGAATGDEIAELWEDFLRSTMLAVALSLVAMTLIVWFTFRALQPIERIRAALRALEGGDGGTRLPAFASPEMNEISTAFNRMADALERGRAEQQRLLRKLVDSEEHTRSSVARDLHDELSPYLVAMQPLARMLQLQCAAHPGTTELAATVDDLVQHQTHILQTLRSILVGLHPPDLETLGLRGSLERMAAPIASPTQRALRVELRLVGAWRSFGPTLDVSVYRIVQECLTNVRRHSTAAQAVVEIDPTRPLGGRRTLRIAVDNPIGQASPAGQGGSGLGVVGMRERCQALGGTFSSGAQGGSWQVRIALPLDAALAEDPDAGSHPQPEPVA